MADIARQKSFPTSLPTPVWDILQAMAIEKKHIRLFGSMNVRSQLYAGDYDANEIVSGSPPFLAKGIQSVIKRLESMKDVFIGDIKLGEIEDWLVIKPDAHLENGQIVGFNAVESLKTLRRLKDANIISPKEMNDGEALLRKIKTPLDFLVAKQTFKFHILRWTPETILAGSQMVRGRRVSLDEAWLSKGVKKLDCIAKDGDRFTDYSMVYVDKHTRKIDVEKSLQEDIYYYTSIRQPFKALKRSFALARLHNDTDALKLLSPILNSDLGRLYHIAGDIYTLVELLEHKDAPLSVIRTEIDRFRARLSYIYTLNDYLKEESTLFGDIISILRLPRDKMASRLDKLGDILSTFLVRNTYRLLEGMKSAPLNLHLIK